MHSYMSNRPDQPWSHSLSSVSCSCLFQYWLELLVFSGQQICDDSLGDHLCGKSPAVENISIVSANFALQLATLSLGIAAGIATAVITTVVNGINSSGDDVGISAEQGNYFVAMIWIAVALLFLSSLTSLVQICTRSGSSGGGRRSQRMRMDQKGSYGMPMMPPRYNRGSIPYYMPMGMNEDPYMDPYSSRRNLRDDEYEEFR